MRARDDVARVALGLLVLGCGLALAACSASRISETYDGAGQLAERHWRTHQLGTTRQASMAMEQVDGAYSITSGESVSVDPATVEIVRMPLDTFAAAYGMSQARRAGAFAPVSVDRAGTGGFQARPITAEQAAALETVRRLTTQVELQEAELARLREEMHAAEEHGQHEARPLEAPTSAAGVNPPPAPRGGGE